MKKITSPYKYLEPDILHSLNISFSSREVVEGSISGLHKSPYQGFNVEFAQHREYIPGEDELKNIDWKVYARSDKLYIKQYEEETDLRAYFLIDTSESMKFSSLPISKFDYAAYLTSALTYLLHKQGDSSGLILFNSQIDTFIPPRSSTSHCDLIFRTLEKANFRKKTNIAHCLHELADRIKKRGVIFIFSDLYDEPEKIALALRHFRHKKHEVILFHLLDEMEFSLDFEGETLFIDYETGEKLSINPKEILHDYHQELNKFISFFRELSSEIHLTYREIKISTPYKIILQQFLHQRLRGRI